MTPMFDTFHAPVGAWSSFTFGSPARGFTLQQETPAAPGGTGDLLVGVFGGEGHLKCLPFVGGTLSGVEPIAADALTRTLTPCADEYVAMIGAVKLTFKVYTPHAAVPNPKRARTLQFATVPGLLLEVQIDNSNSDEPATGFVGMNYRGAGTLRRLEWAARNLCGVAEAGHWALAAQPVPKDVCTAHAADIAGLSTGVAAGVDAKIGGIAIHANGRATRNVFIALAFHADGIATQGLDGRRTYGTYFPRVETVANFVLANSGRLRESCLTFDTRAKAMCPDETRRAIFSQAIRAYDAGTQIVDAVGAPQYTVLDGAAAWRNAIDAAVDHLPWELYRNPWVVRNIFDLFTASYSYADQTIFPDEADVQMREGGMSLCRDMGVATTYAPPTSSASERSNITGVGSYMTSESLLNAVYMLTCYALSADDNPWAKTRLPFARELLISMENRDHHDVAQRNGILKAESILCGPKGAEVTTFAPVDSLLGASRGSVYLAVKTFCANLLLTTYFQHNNDLHSADYSYAMAQRTATTLAAAFDEARSLFPVNLYQSSDAAALAILEPLAIPTYLGLTSTLAEYFPSLVEKLKRHAVSCLKNGVGIDAVSGGLRLVSSSPAVRVSKVTSTIYVLEQLLGIDVTAEAPKAIEALWIWHQKGFDIVDASTGAGLGEYGSPRLASAMLLLKNVLVEQQEQAEPAEAGEATAQP